VATLLLSQLLHGENYMLLNHSFRRHVHYSLIATTLVVTVTCSALLHITAAESRTRQLTSTDANANPHSDRAVSRQLNISNLNLPLLNLDQQRLNLHFDQLLSYPAEQFDFPIFKSLSFDEARGRYLLPTISKADERLGFIELARASGTVTYRSESGVELIDRDSTKLVKTPDGTKYLFIQYPDGEFRCANIRQANGAVLNLLYSANGLALHGLVDSSRRSVTFNYDKDGIRSLTQTWMSDVEGFTKTWMVGDLSSEEYSAKYAHVVGARVGKFLPSNAVVQEYTKEMAASDQVLARTFGGPTAVAAGNGFEPPGLAMSYPLYRGDIIGDDGILRAGHLSHAMHLYGSADGLSDSPLYVPAGFTSHSSEPTPTDAAVLFYYPKLGNLTDVTLAVFHVAEFQIITEGDRVRIGKIGGPGGSSPFYKHSHIDFYKGNVGLPAAEARAALRIDPGIVFSAR
jgi:hypothetical protein